MNIFFILSFLYKNLNNFWTPFLRTIAVNKKNYRKREIGPVIRPTYFLNFLFLLFWNFSYLCHRETLKKNKFRVIYFHTTKSRYRLSFDCLALREFFVGKMSKKEKKQYLNGLRKIVRKNPENNYVRENDIYSGESKII